MIFSSGDVLLNAVTSLRHCRDADRGTVLTLILCDIIVEMFTAVLTLMLSRSWSWCTYGKAETVGVNRVVYTRKSSSHEKAMG